MIKDDRVLDALKLSRRGSRVKRFHTVSLLAENTVGQHTFNLMGILFACVPVGRLRWQLLAAAWQHDIAEAVVGDVPSPTKKALGGIDNLERATLNDNGMHDVSEYLYGIEVKWIKLADALEGWLFCLEELDMGNGSLGDISCRYASYVEKCMDALREKDDVSADEFTALRNFSELVDYATERQRKYNGL